MAHAMILLNKLGLFRPTEDPILEARFTQLELKPKRGRRAHRRNISPFATRQQFA